MGLRILHSADWHLDSPFRGFSGEQRTFLRDAQLRLPRMVADLCRREGCQLMLLSGDIFDGPYRRETALLLGDIWSGLGIPVCIAPGNHDFCAPGSPWLAEPWPENVHIFTGGLTSLPFPALNCRVWGAGFGSMDCPALLEGFRAEGPEGYQLGILHGDPLLPTSPYCPVTTSQVRDSGLDYLALGHIHRSGSFRAGSTLCGWPGCPMGRGYDETGEKGVYIVDLEETASLRFLPLDTPRFFQMEAQLPLEDPRDLLPALESTDFYRLTLTGSGAGEWETLLKKFPNLELLDRREPERDLWDGAGADTLEGTFLAILRERFENAGGDAAETIRLAAQISRQLLDGREVKL